MPALGAVDPHGVRVGHVDSEDGHLVLSSAGGSWYKAGVETGGVGVHGDRLARLVEGGLGDGVVASGKLELDHLADIDADVIGCVR